MKDTLIRLLKELIVIFESTPTCIIDEDIENFVKTLTSLREENNFISKYQAYSYLNMSRATFDNLVREGKLPKGKKRQGFKELFWDKRELDNNIKQLKSGK